MQTNMRNLWCCLVLLIAIQALIISCEKISPKLDFEEGSELVQVKKEIKTGKIKGLRVTVDTSELKGLTNLSTIKRMFFRKVLIY